MTSTTERFTTRVDTYARYRPSYPTQVIELLRAECGLTEAAIVADVGSGTGILSELLLRNGNEVFGVEPNEAMRTASERQLASYAKFKAVVGSAEKTTLASASVDLITASQAFHWFDATLARAEFKRILKPDGFVALIWNDRRLDSTPFLRDYEELLKKFGTDYAQVQQFNSATVIADFFAPRPFKCESFENVQRFNLEGFQGRVFSASYTPEPGDPRYEPMVKEMERLFSHHQHDNSVAFEYDTKVYYGKLT